MLCERCGINYATAHIKTVVNGIVKEYNLCPICAAKEGYASNNLAGMLASMFGEIKGSELSTKQTKCSICGSTFSDIAKSGRVGCSECYTTFYGQLLPYLKRVHGSIKHSGKVPYSQTDAIKVKIETIDDLRQELNRLVAEEKYEQAAIIRDKIKEKEEKENE